MPRGGLVDREGRAAVLSVAPLLPYPCRPPFTSMTMPAALSVAPISAAHIVMLCSVEQPSYLTVSKP